MKKYCWILALIAFGSCSQNCNEDLRIGEQLSIQIDLSNYTAAEAAELYIRIMKGGSYIEQPLRDILIANDLVNPRITDQNTDGYYSSNLDGASLYFFQVNNEGDTLLKDSLTRVVVKKSKEDVDDPCYKDHPNVQIDELSYVHAEEQKGPNDVAVIRK